MDLISFLDIFHIKDNKTTFNFLTVISPICFISTNNSKIFRQILVEI